MKPASTFQYYCLAWFSRPAHERCLYRVLRGGQVRSLVELGVGDGRRTQRLLAVAQRFAPEARLQYTGIDLFEARPADAPGMSLKDAHRTLTRTGVHLRLAPGDPFSALARCANALVNTDLLVISADQDPAALERAWYYVPRMLHATSLVFLEERDAGRGSFRRLTLRDVEPLARQQGHQRAA